MFIQQKQYFNALMFPNWTESIDFHLSVCIFKNIYVLLYIYVHIMYLLMYTYTMIRCLYIYIYVATPQLSNRTEATVNNPDTSVCAHRPTHRNQPKAFGLPSPKHKGGTIFHEIWSTRHYFFREKASHNYPAFGHCSISPTWVPIEWRRIRSPAFFFHPRFLRVAHHVL